MSTANWRIEQFYGLDQSKDGALCNEGTSPDARNMDTTDGNLSVAKGFVKHITIPIPGTGPVRRVFVMKLYSTLVYGVIAKAADNCMHLYAYDPSGPEWDDIYTWPSTVQGNYWDFLQCNIGNYDYVLIANGESQMVKWDGISSSAELFGSVDIVLTTTVSSYTASTKTVVLTDAISEDVAKRMRQCGIVIAGVTHRIASVTTASKSVVLANTPATAPAAGNEVKVRGGLSDAKVNYLAMHYSRLFCAGDPENPNRLYYSQIPGDGRNIEDWSSDEVTGSANTGGGFVEIGDSVGDPIMGIVSLSTQLLIFKRYSIYRLMGDRPSYFTIERVDAEVEQMSHTSVTRHGDIAFYLTPAGLYYFNNVTVQPMNNARNIRTFMNGCKVSMSKACEAQDCLYFTCYKGDNPDARQYDNAILIYDITRGSYMIRDGFNVADIVAVDGTIYMVNDNRYLYRFNEGADYDGEPIAAYWYTQCTDLQNRGTEKKIDEVYLRGAGETPLSPILLDTYCGTLTHHTRKLMVDERDILEIQPNIDAKRTFQFKISNEAGSRFSLHGGMEVHLQLNQRSRNK